MIIHARLYNDKGMPEEGIPLCCGKILSIRKYRYNLDWHFVFDIYDPDPVYKPSQITCEDCLRSDAYKNAVLSYELTK